MLAKDLKDQFIGMSIKQKVRPKIQQMNIDNFYNKNIDEDIRNIKRHVFKFC